MAMPGTLVTRGVTSWRGYGHLVPFLSTADDFYESAWHLGQRSPRGRPRAPWLFLRRNDHPGLLGRSGVDMGAHRSPACGLQVRFTKGTAIKADSTAGNTGPQHLYDAIGAGNLRAYVHGQAHAACNSVLRQEWWWTRTAWGGPLPP